VNLEPVCEALVAEALRDAEDMRAAAQRDAAGVLAQARDEADRLLEAASAEGEAEARAVASTELARARRQARERVLDARQAAYRRADAEAARAASLLRNSPAYSALITGLSDVARGQLGAGAEVTVDKDVGGLVAVAGSRSVDYRLPIVASRCVRALGAEVETLWR
jgi:vacuolar-type H+-ATPase subunit E/Vma4